MGGMMAMMWISNGIWLGLMIILGLAVWYWIRGHADIRHRAEDPLAILQLRLARGEITPEEYEDLRQRLTSF